MDLCQMTSKALRSLSEADFAKAVVALAREHGYHVYTSRDLRPSRATLRGYPDLHLFSSNLRDSLFLELKTERGRMSEAQKETHDKMIKAGLEVHVLRPRDFGWLVERLERGHWF